MSARDSRGAPGPAGNSFPCARVRPGMLSPSLHEPAQRSAASVRSSTLQSLERGRPTEIEWLNGAIVALGERHGVDAAVNRRVVEIVKEIEEGRRAIGPANLRELATLPARRGA